MNHGQATDPTGPTGILATWLQDFELGMAPPSARDRTKDLILDGLGCALVGAKLPWSQVAANAVFAFEGAGKSQIIGWNRSLAAPAAALLNGTFIQGFELDDFHPFGPLHSASIVLPALLAIMRPEDPISGKQFLCAALAGFEVGPRVGMALHGAQMLSRGWHSGSVFGTHAAAAAVGVLHGFDAATFEDALGLAGTQSSGLMAAQYEAMCKRMHHGFAARNGLAAALLAKGGYTGIKRIFEREYGGFLSVFGEGHEPDASQITDGLGKRWEVERIAIKPYAAMGALHAPLDALFALREKHSFSIENIERIDVYMSHVGYHHGWWEPERPFTPVAAQMHVGYALAVAILDDAAMVRQFAPDRIDADDVWKLMPRIRAHHDQAYDTEKMTRGAAKVRITLSTGDEFEEEIRISHTIAQPLSRKGVVEKFRVLTGEVMEVDRTERLIDLVMDLEQCEDLGRLTGLLAPTVCAPFD